jgi:GMP synthase (glutamine-hydrolysing)
MGEQLGIPADLVWRHPFPGPGLGIRILGEVTPDRVRMLQEADDIFISEIRDSGLYRNVGQALAALDPTRAVGVMGDKRMYGHIVLLRAVETKDFMTADWYPFEHAFLKRVSTKIVNEVDGVARVLYDVTSKPPGTIEFE